MEIAFTTEVWKEGKIYISYAKELEVCSCGRTVKEAKQNLIEAVECFLETAEEMGTLDQLLQEAGFLRGKRMWKAPPIISSERTSIPIPNK